MKSNYDPIANLAAEWNHLYKTTRFPVISESRCEAIHEFPIVAQWRDPLMNLHQLIGTVVLDFAYAIEVVQLPQKKYDPMVFYCKIANSPDMKIVKVHPPIYQIWWADKNFSALKDPSNAINIPWGPIKTRNFIRNRSYNPYGEFRMEDSFVCGDAKEINEALCTYPRKKDLIPVLTVAQRVRWINLGESQWQLSIV